MAELVRDALQNFDEQRYRLFAWCIMPNHVHVVARLFPGMQLASVLHSWKSFTSTQAGKLLGVRGDFWQREYYDHLLRREAEFERSVHYVAENPVRAGLERWHWVLGARARRPRDSRRDAGATFRELMPFNGPEARRADSQSKNY